MIYLDSSVALAHIFAEDRSPPKTLFKEPLVSSRLLEYEIWNRLHNRGFGLSHAGEANALIDRVEMVELATPVLARALQPFPVPVRTLDALHLASLQYVRTGGRSVALASYDKRLLAAARALEIDLVAL